MQSNLPAHPSHCEESYSRTKADQGLFEEHMSVVRSDFTSEQIVSHYILNIAPYISPDMNPHALLSAEQVIDLFLNGIRK